MVLSDSKKTGNNLNLLPNHKNYPDPVTVTLKQTNTSMHFKYWKKRSIFLPKSLKTAKTSSSIPEPVSVGPQESLTMPPKQKTQNQSIKIIRSTDFKPDPPKPITSSLKWKRKTMFSNGYNKIMMDWRKNLDFP
jgi:hypothetical protein